MEPKPKLNFNLPIEPRTGHPVVASDKKFVIPENVKLFLYTNNKPNSGIEVRDAVTKNLTFSCTPSKNKWKSIFQERYGLFTCVK